MPGSVLKPATAAALERLIAANPNPPRPRHQRGGTRGRVWVLARCDSATAAGSGGEAGQCYPATIVEGLAGETSLGELGACWLTVYGDTGPIAPTAGRHYVCELAGDFDPDPEGDTDDRARVFATDHPDDDPGGCGFLIDPPASSAYRVVKIEARGRCSCIPTGQVDDDDPEPGFVYSKFYVVQRADGGSSVFYGTRMLSLCCGQCATLSMTIDSDAAPGQSVTGTLTVHGPSCDEAEAGVYTYTLRQDGCGSDEKGPFFYLFGFGTKLCDGTQARCGNGFRLKIRCVDCPDGPDCSACVAGVAPLALYLAPEAAVGGGYEGGYVLPYTGDCTWGMTCGGVTITVRVTDDLQTLIGFGGGAADFSYASATPAENVADGLYPCHTGGFAGAFVGDPPEGVLTSASFVGLGCAPTCGQADRHPATLVVTFDAGAMTGAECDCFSSPMVFVETSTDFYSWTVTDCPNSGDILTFGFNWGCNGGTGGYGVHDFGGSIGIDGVSGGGSVTLFGTVPADVGQNDQSYPYTGRLRDGAIQVYHAGGGPLVCSLPAATIAATYADGGGFGATAAAGATAPAAETRPGLGDMVASALSAVGVTKERVSKALGKDCGCGGRQKKLNEWGRRIGIGT